MSMPARQPSEPVPATFEDRREHRRFKGPFDGHRVAMLDTPVQIYDLSLGGCFINSTHEQKPGVALTLQIELPGEGQVTVEAETLPRQVQGGFAVRFTHMDPDAAMRFHCALKRLEERER
ncbi:MAG TPA: PilZ domain-containing protein [Vicinamibacterales bacterium]|jgi:hypothetical protein